MKKAGLFCIATLLLPAAVAVWSAGQSISNCSDVQMVKTADHLDCTVPPNTGKITLHIL